MIAVIGQVIAEDGSVSSAADRILSRDSRRNQWAIVAKSDTCVTMIGRAAPRAGAG
ncbi:MAG: hypothetical protein ACRDNS_32140 [Trebonia sp.]